MTSVWVAGLVVTVLLALGWLALRALRRTKELEASSVSDVPLWEAEEHNQRDFWPELVEQGGDTAPAVLTPPEWREPQSVSNGTPRPFDRH
jgi:hypothetical protein